MALTQFSAVEQVAENRIFYNGLATIDPVEPCLLAKGSFVVTSPVPPSGGGYRWRRLLLEGGSVDGVQPINYTIVEKITFLGRDSP